MSEYQVLKGVVGVREGVSSGPDSEEGLQKERSHDFVYIVCSYTHSTSTELPYLSVE